jgi:glycosyltransferase involved in cell wall biosynthesis
MNILFLYTELASYFLAGVKELTKKGHSVHIVRWPVNKEAPFQFEFPEGVTIYERNDYNNKQLVDLTRKIKPDIIISSGWVDKGYLKVCRQFKGKIPTVMSMDNQWHGHAKQHLMRLLAPFYLHRSYSHAWVPGAPQKKYALLLGFKEFNIQTGFYSADVSLFSSEADTRIKAEAYPHRIIFVGRYIQAKGLDLLFNAWTELCDEHSHDWELWCAGAGELYDQRIIHPKIKHLGFLQPSELKEQLRHAGVFVLPSRFEPWGVVVHEMAAAGFPMVLSDAIGSASQFLISGTNGYTFNNKDVAGLKSALLSIIGLPDDELKRMAAASHQLGVGYNPEMWAEKIVREIGQ